MRKIIFLPIFLLIIGCSSILAQQRGNTPRQDRPSPPPTTRTTDNIRTRNDRINTADRSSDMKRTENRPATNENRNDAERRRPEVLGKLLSGLNLTDEQKSQTKQILKDAKENNTPRTEVLRQINGVLDERQSEKFKNHIERLKESNMDGQKPAIFRKVLGGLNLSDEQQSQTRRILEEAKANNTPLNEVAREINSILNERQSKKFLKQLKRIKEHKNNNDESTSPSDGDDSNP